MSASVVAADLSGVADVIDGDTIAIRGNPTRVRLWGIDTPEGKQTCRDRAGQRYLCGSRAADALADLIGRNGRVSCEPRDRERYGRIVAICRIHGRDLNAEMVRPGWAVEYTQYSDGRYSALEAEARMKRRGLWSGTFVKPWDWRRGERMSDTAAPPVTAWTSTRLAAARRSCKAASTCEEAVEMWCGGYSRADADGDGIPCETVCHSRSQVEAAKKSVGC